MNKILETSLNEMLIKENQRYYNLRKEIPTKIGQHLNCPSADTSF